MECLSSKLAKQLEQYNIKIVYYSIPTLTEEYFKIKEVLIDNPTVYKLKDLKGEDLNRIFYENELSIFNANDETTYKVEKNQAKEDKRNKIRSG